MSEQQTKDDAAKRRIITHMNEDHHDSVGSIPLTQSASTYTFQIIRYLEYYHGLSSWNAYSSIMANMDLSGMTFVAGGKTYRVPFNPPLSSFRDTRERVVEMDKECLQALKKSDITVKEFVPPTISAFYTIEFCVVAATFLGYSQRWWFAKGSIVERLLGAAFAKFSWTIQPWLISFMLILHGLEAVYFARNHLRRHSVNMRTLMFWQWIGTTFIEGQFAFKRFNDHVQKKREEKQKQKH